jgi:hypothetical protein
MAGRAVEAPWRLSVGGDFALPQTTGPRPRGTTLLGPYMRRVLLAVQRDELVAGRFVEVTNLLRPPASLLAPAVALRTLRASRARPAAQASPSTSGSRPRWPDPPEAGRWLISNLSEIVRELCRDGPDRDS